LLKFANFAGQGKLGEKYLSWQYLLATLAIVIVSGAVTVMQGTEHVPLLRAVHLGIGAPALIGAWATAAERRAAQAKATKKQHQKKGAVEDMPMEPEETDKSLRALLAW
jgi:hypothetical protein